MKQSKFVMVALYHDKGGKIMPDKGEVTVAEAGRRGGRSTLKNQGVEFFREIGRKGGRKTAESYADFLKEWGSKGGRPRLSVLDESVGEGERQ